MLGQRDALPDGFAPLQAGSLRAEAMLRELGGGPFVLGAAEALALGICSPAALEPTIEMLRQAAREAERGARWSDWTDLLAKLVVLKPDDLHAQVQLAFGLKRTGRLADLLPLVESTIPLFTQSAKDHGPYLAVVVEAAYTSGRFDLIETNLPSLGTFVDMTVEAKAMCRRVGFLKHAGASLAFPAVPLPAELRFREAAFALDELSQSAKLAEGARELTGQAQQSLEVMTLLLVVAAVARMERWGTAYHTALLQAEMIANGIEIEAVRAIWSRVGLPSPAFEPFHLAANPSDEATMHFEAAFTAFHASPGLATARVVWNESYLAGHSRQLILVAPEHDDELSPTARAKALRTLGPPEHSGANLWLFMTWREDSDRLLQTLAAYAGDATIVVGVGGDANSPGFARASAVLLAKDIHLLVRPIVTWGDQRCMFHNLFEVLAAFRDQSGADGWLQNVCDRTYPLKSLATLKAWTTSGRITPTVFGPPAWHREWSEETAQNLPALYERAIEEAFENAAPRKFAELATRSPFFGDNDDRLLVNAFNFSDKPLRITWDPRTRWHGYYVSPFEADVRWMSFARLQEYVSLGTEAMSSFARRLHPTTMRWAHGVLNKYDLRTGDPWVYISRRYADRIMDDPGFEELFSVMNMGFAPEMNYFDTVAASFNLEDDFFHHYHVLPNETAIDADLPETCEGADLRGRAFVRKTDSIAGAQLLSHFANRIFQDHQAGGVNWAVAGGAFADDEMDPRPYFDEALVQRFLGRPMCIRDLLGRRSQNCRFEPNVVVAVDDDDRIVARWRLEGRSLIVDFVDSALGIKKYERPAGDARHFTLAPAEIIGAHNAWSAVLEFPLEALDASHDSDKAGLGQAQEVLVRPGPWVGAGTADAAILAVFADPARSSMPTPTVTVQGGVYELRRTHDALLGLCSIDGMPALLEVCGWAQMGARTAVTLKLAGERQAADWDNGVPGRLDGGLPRSDIFGLWTLQVMEGVKELRLTSDNWILDSGNGGRIGRWFLRAEGVQILGLDQVRMGLADHLRLDSGVWRLSGWGWRNMRDAVTFRLTKVSSSD